MWIQNISAFLRVLITHFTPVVGQLLGQVVYRADSATQALPCPSSS